MIVNPLAFGIGVFFALITIAPKRPDFGERWSDYLAILAGAIISATFFSVSVSAAAAQGGPSQSVYEARYTLSGFLLRASKICDGNEQDIAVAFSLLDPDELKAFSKAFPKKTRDWMQKGADSFNIGVMKDGIPAACTYALQVLEKARVIAQNNGRGSRR
jgi:hypothetical protein